MRLLLIAALAACAPVVPVFPADAPAELPPDQTRHFTIWLGGARVGTAIETETWTHAGVTLHRVETMRFYRGDAPIAITTTIDIAADPALVPRRVAWTERSATLRHAEALREGAALVAHTDEGTLRLPGNAIPAELVPLVLRRDGHFAGTMFLPARGFVTGTGAITAVAPGRLVARFALDAGPLVEATIDVARDGTFTRIVDGEGVIAIRASAAQALAPFPPVDLIAATSLPLSGAHTHHLALDGDLALPPLPGQAAQSDPSGGIIVELSAKLAGALPAGPTGADRVAEIRALVARVRGRIVPDLGASPTTAATASSATAGDCTTFALAYAALATGRSIPTRVVTGLRVDGDRLVRHRWAVSWTGRAWIAVDAAFGAAPAGGDLVGLAIHDADDAGLVAGEAALTAVRSASWR